MQNLKEICLKEICNNLLYISKICEKRKWEIPGVMADETLDYVFKHNRSVSKDQLKIFSRERTKLTKFTSPPRIFNLPFCDFLDGHELNNLSLRSLLTFGFESKKVQLITNSFSIENVLFKDYEEEDLDHLFQYSIQVKESVFIKLMKIDQFISKFMYSLKNSCKTLKILSIKDCYFSVEDLKSLSIFLSSNSSLEKLTLHGNLYEHYSEYLQMISSLRKSCKSLKTLNFKQIPEQNNEFSDMLSNMNNLEELSLEFCCRKKKNSFKCTLRNRFFLFQKSIFQTLIENNLKNFKKLKLKSYDMSTVSKSEIEDFFKKYQKIEIIEFANVGKSFNCKFLHYLLNKFCKNLKKFKLPKEMYKIFNNLSSNIFIENCSNLYELDFHFGNWSSKNAPIFLMKCIEKSRSTLKCLFVSNQNNEFDVPLLKTIQKIKCLEKFSFTFKANLETELTLINIIEMNKDNLLQLDLRGSYENDKIVCLLTKSLSECSRLKSLAISDYDERVEFEDLLNSRSLFLKEIEHLSFHSRNYDDSNIGKLFKILDKCVNLRKFTLSDVLSTNSDLATNIEKVELINFGDSFLWKYSFDEYYTFNEKRDCDICSCFQNLANPNEKDKIKIRGRKIPDNDKFYKMLYR